MYARRSLAAPSDGARKGKSRRLAYRSDVTPARCGGDGDVGEDKAVGIREAGYCASLHLLSGGVPILKGPVIHAGDGSKGCENSELRS